MKLKRSVFVVFLAALLLLAGCSSVKLPSVENASFDSGTSGWTEKSYYKDGVEIKAVNDSGHGGAAFISVGSENDARLVQELPVSSNTAYRISCDVRTEGVSGGAGANIGVYGVAVTGDQVFGDSDWHTIELVGRTAEGQKTLAVSVGVGSHGGLSTGKAWFDNVRIELAESADKLLGSNASKSGASSEEAPTEFPTAGILAATVLSTCFLLIFVILHKRSANKPLKLDKKGGAGYVLMILAAALAVRVALSFIFYGHKTDINCFTAWGRRLIEVGPAHFYDQWCDYPPGYMLVLGAMSWINKLVGGDANVYALIVKLPCIAADLICAYLIYRYAKKTMSLGAALLLMAVVAFTPVMAYVSSAWGQIDQVLALMLILPILLLYKRRPVLAGLVFGLGIAMKPQALMCGPLFAAACLVYVIKGAVDEGEKPHGLSRLLSSAKKPAVVRLIEIIIAVIGAFAVIYLISIPFRGEQEPLWIVKKYFDTATSYKFATVNAYNFWALIGANWKSVDTPFLGLTYGKWGTAAMVFFVAVGMGLYIFASFKHKVPKGALPLAMAYSLVGIFTFGHYMHERYVFPALMLIMLAYLFYNDRYLLWTYFAYSATILLNCIAAFYYSKLYEYGLYWDERIIFWCSLVNVILFAAFTVQTFALLIGNKPKRGYNG